MPDQSQRHEENRDAGRDIKHLTHTYCGLRSHLTRKMENVWKGLNWKVNKTTLVSAPCRRRIGFMAAMTKPGISSPAPLLHPRDYTLMVSVLDFTATRFTRNERCSMSFVSPFASSDLIRQGWHRGIERRRQLSR